MSVKESLPDKTVFEQIPGGVHSRQWSQTKKMQPRQKLSGTDMLELFEEKLRKLVWLQESEGESGEEGREAQEGSDFVGP